MLFQVLGIALGIFIANPTSVSRHDSNQTTPVDTASQHAAATNDFMHESGQTQVTILPINKGSGETLRATDILADAWIYPDAAGALGTLKTAGNINAVKEEFMHVEDDGSLRQINQNEDYPNGYSPQNVALIKQHSKEQYFTVSGALDGTRQAMQNPETIPKIVALADRADFNVEIDWEDFGEWDPDYYDSFKTFTKTLHAKLQDHGHKLMIDGPPIYDQTSQSWYQWKYEEIQPLVDETVMMVYDNQFDTGAGNSIAPADWSRQCMKWLKDKTGGKGIAGVAAYGYEGRTGSYRMAINTTDGIRRRADGVTFRRNSDGELTATKDGMFYDIADQETLARRLQQVEDSGLRRLSVWSLGQNPWFK